MQQSGWQLQRRPADIEMFLSCNNAYHQSCLGYGSPVTSLGMSIDSLDCAADCRSGGGPRSEGGKRAHFCRKTVKVTSLDNAGSFRKFRKQHPEVCPGAHALRSLSENLASRALAARLQSTNGFIPARLCLCVTLPAIAVHGCHRSPRTSVNETRCC